MDLILGYLFGTIVGCDSGRESVGWVFGRGFVVVGAEGLGMVGNALTKNEQLQ